MSRSSDLTSIQGWLRDHSEKLAISFKSSGRIEHCVTKGVTREHQILDTLCLLLPTRLSVETNVVIVDARDEQSPQFDGFLIDRMLWPRASVVDGTPVAMVESVVAAIEVKSTLGKAALDDIFQKSSALRRMALGAANPPTGPTRITAFAYKCPNLRLSFFDFAASFGRSPKHSPSLICILNAALFGLAELGSKSADPVDEPHSGAVPVFYDLGEDALLLYLYFLSRWAAMGTSTAEVLRRYSGALFSRMTCFQFDADFLDAVLASDDARARARGCFEGQPDGDIEELYTRARQALGLPSTPLGR